MPNQLKHLQERVGYHFRNPKLLTQAVTHSSYANEHGSNRLLSNERLEFLGDAVLELTSSEFIFEKYPDYPEGEMTKLRASIVCEPTLADCARFLELPACLKLGRGEEATGGRERDSIISDAMEAVIGAIYLDGGFANAKEFVNRFIMEDLEERKLFYDSKTILQELVQDNELGELTYRLVRAEGPDHAKVFTSEAWIEDECYGSGTGRNKKLSEQLAAYQAIVKIRKGSGKDVSEED